MAAAPYAIVAADRPANGAADSVNSRLIKAPGELSESFFYFKRYLFCYMIVKSKLVKNKIIPKISGTI